MTVFQTTAKYFFPLDLFCKLATNSSERLLLHCAIREQIEALIHSTAEFQSLCAVFHKKIYSSIVATRAEG